MVQSSLRWIMENLGENQNASQMPNRLAFVTEKWKSIRKCWKANLRAFPLPSRWKSNASQHSGDLAVFVWFLVFAAKWCWLFRWRKLCNYFFHSFFSQAVTRFSPWWPTSSYCINNLPITLHTVLFYKICFFFFLPFFLKEGKIWKHKNTRERESCWYFYDKIKWNIKQSLLA